MKQNTRPNFGQTYSLAISVSSFVYSKKIGFNQAKTKFVHWNLLCAQNSPVNYSFGKQHQLEKIYINNPNTSSFIVYFWISKSKIIT